MRYYIRHDKNAKVEGPFSVEALLEGIRVGRIPSDVLASSDLGDDVAALQVWRSCDWFPLAAIAELREVVPPLSVPPAKSQRVSVFTVFVYVTLALSLSYRAITEQRWFVCILAVLMVYNAVHTIVYYVRQSETRSPSV